MADSFGDDGLSDDEGSKNGAQFISEPTGEPNEGEGQKGNNRFPRGLPLSHKRHRAAPTR